MSNFLRLATNEKIIKVINQHKLTLVVKLLLPLICLACLFFLWPFILRWENFGLLIFLGFGLALLLIIFRIIFIWRQNKCLLTNLRLIDIDQRGLFKKIVSEATLQNIIDISYELDGLIQNVFNFGNIYIMIAQGNSKILLKNIAKPAQIQNLLHELIKNNLNLQKTSLTT